MTECVQLSCVEAPMKNAPEPHIQHEPPGEPIHLPAPSIYPAICAAGFTLLGFGILTSLIFSICGLLVLVWGLAGWVREMLHE